MPYTSRIPQIIVTAERHAAAANARIARKIAQDASGRAPRRTGRLRSSIKAVPDDGPDWRVEVGAFYGHFIEFGTAREGARPFLTPAAEAHRAEHRAALTGLYR